MNMFLDKVITEKTIKKRHEILSKYLQIKPSGVLNETDTLDFKHIFEMFYTPDKFEEKFEVNNISSVSIVKDKYGNKCFSICVNNVFYPTSIKRLSGSTRTHQENLKKALRTTIKKQITDFRIANPLNMYNICPITNNILGNDAEVDHEIPFHILSNNWLNNNKLPPSIKYIREQFSYILDEPYFEQWYNYHLEHAKLRWVSKEGNKIAHKMYIC